MRHRHPPRCPADNHHLRTDRHKHDGYANTLDWPSVHFLFGLTFLVLIFFVFLFFIFFFFSLLFFFIFFFL